MLPPLPGRPRSAGRPTCLLAVHPDYGDAALPDIDSTLRNVLDSAGRFLILDSAWSPERAQFNTKTERQSRRLNDGTAFEIYKRDCDRDDISRWAQEHGVSLRIEHFGPAFYAVSGVFNRRAGSSS